jgi:putative flippase GtrA
MVETIRRSDHARQCVRFLIVGVGNTALSFVVYRVLLALGLWYVVAAPLAFAAGAVNGYIFNRRWTFAARDSTRARVIYVGVAIMGAVATSLLVPLFVAVGLGKVVAYLAAIPPVTVCMFVANRVWTFADRDGGYNGVVFRDGPAGRRAVVVGGPDVWEVIMAARSAPESGEELIRALTERLGVPSENIQIAIRYYAKYPEEVDRFIEMVELEAGNLEQTSS